MKLLFKSNFRQEIFKLISTIDRFCPVFIHAHQLIGIIHLSVNCITLLDNISGICKFQSTPALDNLRQTAISL